MVAKVQITTTVAPDGSVRLLDHEIEPAGIRPGDRIRIEIVKVDEREISSPPTDAPADRLNDDLSLDDLARLSFDEWLERFRVDFPISDDTDVEELIRQGEEAVAQEYWERFDQHG